MSSGLLIAGSRSAQPELKGLFFQMFDFGLKQLADYGPFDRVIEGGAKGIDRLGREWAESRGFLVRTMEADWHAHGKAAGPIRNAEMAKAASAAIVVWDGKSRGTQNMVQELYQLKVPHITLPMLTCPIQTVLPV